MAKISELKKDVAFVASEIITQCFLTTQLFPDSDNKQLNKIIYRAVDFKTSILTRINTYPKKSSKKEIKQYFKKVETDMVKQTRDMLGDIEKTRKTK